MAEETVENLESNKKVAILSLDWTHTEALNRYTTETGKILPRRMTGLSAKEQRHVTLMVKRARNMLLAK